MRKKVSIIIPVYNAQKYLEENIKSVLAQTYKNIEIIYVCDGCTDGSYDILKKYDYDDRIKIINRHNNLGAAQSRNQGAKEATGEWLIFWDADDIVSCNAIEAMYNAGEKYDADMVICSYGNINEKRKNSKKRIFIYLKEQIESYPLFLNKGNMLDISSLIICNAPFNKLIKRKIFETDKVWFQDLKNCNDIYYSVAAFLISKKVVYVEEKLYWYRSNSEGSISLARNSSKTYILDALTLIRELVLELKYDEMIFKKLAFVEIMGYRGTKVYDHIITVYEEEYKEKWKIPYDRNYLYCLNKFDMIIGKNVIVYGAGQVGNDYIKDIELKASIVGVVDGKGDGKKIKMVESIKDMTYDYIIIATLSDISAEQMYNKLLEIGVENKKIIVDYPVYLFNKGF